MPFKHYIRRVEGREEPILKRVVYKCGSQYTVALPPEIRERCAERHRVYGDATWGMWRDSLEKAISDFENATDSQLYPASVISGQLRYSMQSVEVIDV